MENFGFDLLMESMGAIAIGAVATAVYLLFALGYACFLKARPPTPGMVSVQPETGGGS